MKAAAVWLSALLALTTAPGATCQNGSADSGAASVWNRVDECLENNLLRQMPDLIRELDALADREAGTAARCHFEAARLYLRLGDEASASRRFEAAMLTADHEYSRRSAAERARLASSAGDFTRAAGILQSVRARCGRSGRSGAAETARVDVELARTHLRAGIPGRALRYLERARVVAESAPRPFADAEPGLEYDIACVEGEALEALGALGAAQDAYWREFRRNPAACWKAFSPKPGTFITAVRFRNVPCSSRYATIFSASFGPIPAA